MTKIFKIQKTYKNKNNFKIIIIKLIFNKIKLTKYNRIILLIKNNQ